MVSGNRPNGIAVAQEAVTIAEMHVSKVHDAFENHDFMDPAGDADFYRRYIRLARNAGEAYITAARLVADELKRIDPEGEETDV